MIIIPIGWTPQQPQDEQQFEEQLIRAMTEPIDASDWPYGCGWCGRSNNRDGVEYCERLQGVVHADCHEERCTFVQCAAELCTEDRCDVRDECDSCSEAVCKRHGVSECLC